MGSPARTSFDRWIVRNDLEEIPVAKRARLSQPTVNKARRGGRVTIASAARLATITGGEVALEEFNLGPAAQKTLRLIRSLVVDAAATGPKRTGGATGRPG